MNEIYNTISQYISDFSSDPTARSAVVFSLMAGIGYSIISFLKNIPNKIWPRIKRLFHFQITIEQSDDIYAYFSQWLEENHMKKFKSVHIGFSRSTGNGRSTHELKSNSKNNLQFTCQNDYIHIYHNNRIIKVQSIREKNENQGSLHVYFGKYVVSGFFAKNAIVKLMTSLEVNKTKEFQPNQYNHNRGYWVRRSFNFIKDFDNLFYNNKQKISNHIDNFINNKEEYERRGIFYKTGILLYGPAGTCKTVTAQSLAKKYNKNLYILNISKMKDNTFYECISEIKKDSIVLIDDIDVCVPERDSDSENSLSLSSLLSFLDGPLAVEGVIVVATTNEFDKLDYALVRDGRFDLKLEMPNPSKENIQDFVSHYWNEKVELDFSADKLNMAKIQNICLNTNCLEETVREINKL